MRAGVGLLNSAALAGGGGGGVTWNPSDKNASITLSSGNLIATFNSGSWAAARATLSKASGKWYFEVKVLVTGGSANRGVGIGNASANLSNYIGADANAWGHLSDGYKTNAGYIAYGVSWENVNDVVMIAYDLTAGQIWFGKSGTWMASGNPAAGTNPAYTGVSGTVFPMCGAISSTASLQGIFNSGSLTYTPPSGFSALS